MCGIAGIFGDHARDPGVVRAMAAALTHRGPDDAGMWADAEAGIAFAHRRLAVVDLSPAGHQPMLSADGRFVITFNGEIYNFGEIRDALEAERAAPEGGWRGHCDTEVLLQAIATWGLDAALAQSVGMFAFALWDRRERLLTLVRDRFGEKPLYYGWAGCDFVFGSELNALRAHPGFDNAIDRRAVGLFALRTHVPVPLSIYRRVFKLPPGCLLEVSTGGAREPLDDPPEEGVGAGVRLKRYWSYRDAVERGLADPIAAEADALLAVESAVSQSVRGQSFADVPVGAFLSGGIDSSTIVAFYQQHSAIPVRTFSIGFEEAGFDEAQHAKSVAKHLGTIHHEQYVTAEQAREVIPLLPSIYDEPFADSSQIPTYLVSRFARGEVKVALTGDGGDELFGGYNRHVHVPRLWRQLQRVPVPLRTLAGSPFGRACLRTGGMLARPGQPLTGKIDKALGIAASARSFDDVYRGLVEEWPSGGSPVPGAEAIEAALDLELGRIAADEVRTMYGDALHYLPDDILTKVDRAAMAVSLETRVPFLDHRVAEVAARVPLRMKIGGGRGKLILRNMLDRHVPRVLVDRPKAGFAVPVGAWLKGPLRDWAEGLLDPAALRTEGWFDADLVTHRWRDHLAGRRESTAAIWAVLMFQAWLREQHRSDN